MRSSARSQTMMVSLSHESRLHWPSTDCKRRLKLSKAMLGCKTTITSARKVRLLNTLSEQEKRYRSMQEHIRRAHPDYYIPKLPATEESFQLMINTPPSHKPPPAPAGTVNRRCMYRRRVDKNAMLNQNSGCQRTRHLRRRYKWLRNTNTSRRTTPFGRECCCRARPITRQQPYLGLGVGLRAFPFRVSSKTSRPGRSANAR